MRAWPCCPSPQGQVFTVELSLSDTSATRRRLFLSSSFSEVKCTPLHCQVPLSNIRRDVWLNLALPLAELTASYFKGAVFRCSQGAGQGVGRGR